jgi:hypothetical protein
MKELALPQSRLSVTANRHFPSRNKVEIGPRGRVIEAVSAKRVIEDETVMDGDRECVNAAGDVLLSGLFIRIRRSFL